MSTIQVQVTDNYKDIKSSTDQIELNLFEKFRVATEKIATIEKKLP